MTLPRFQVAITDFINDPVVTEKQILGDIADVHTFDAYDETELHGKIEEADAIMLYHNLSITKATLEMSSEIVLDRLLDKLIRFALEVAGADLGFLLVEERGILTVRAKRSSSDKEDSSIRNIRTSGQKSG